MYKWIVLGSLIFSFSEVAFGQSKEKVGYEKVNTGLSNSMQANLIDRLNERSYDAIINEHLDSATYFADEALQKSSALNYTYGLARAYCNKARIEKHFHDDFPAAEALAFKSLYWYGQSPRKDGIDSLYEELQFALFSQSKYTEAAKYASRQYQWCSQKGDQQGMWNSLNSVGIIYYQEGKYDSALNCFLPVYEQELKARNEKWTMINLFLLGGIYRAIGDYPSALDYYRMAFEKDNSDRTNWRHSADLDY